MEDNSFAIHPAKHRKIANTHFNDIGNLETVEQRDNIYRFRCEKGYVNLEYYREDIIRITMDPKREPTRESTFAVIAQRERIGSKLEEYPETLEIKGEKTRIIINKNPFRIVVFDQYGNLIVGEGKNGMGYKGKEVICYKEMNEKAHFYGFGEKTSFLDKRGEKMKMFNSDVYAPHNPEIDEMYQSIPFFLTLNEGKTHGIFFDNSYKTTFDLKSAKDYYSFSAEGGKLDYYILIGPTPEAVLEQYTYLTGRMPLVPKWAIGYQQSRYSYESEEEVREIVKNFTEKNIPLDVLYLDIHYMDGFRVFTFDEEKFPNYRELIKELLAEGIHVVPIVDPGVKVDNDYYIYREGMLGDHFCRYLDGKIYYGDVWPGKSAFPDFPNSKTRKWWGENHRFYTDLGIEGIWNDMNEPAVFNESKTMDLEVVHRNDGSLKTHQELHNTYAFYMAEATYKGMKQLLKEKRPFVLTRAGFAGIQRYSAVWTGDNRSFWEHLAMSIPMLLNMGVSGLTFVGTDVGGFAHDSTGELLTRWTQVGAFTPFFRNHSAIGTIRQEPWEFGEQYEKIIKRYIELRYEWLPQFYTLFYQASITGTPVMRPLWWHNLQDENTFNLSNQFMVGNNVIIAPILEPNSIYRSVYLPEGEWYDYWRDDIYEGGKYHLIKADLSTLPIFVKANSGLLHTNAKRNTLILDKELIIHLYLGDISNVGELTIYEDDGITFDYLQEKRYLAVISWQAEDEKLFINWETKTANYQPTWQQVKWVIHGRKELQSIKVNDEEIKLNEEISGLKNQEFTTEVPTSKR